MDYDAKIAAKMRLRREGRWNEFLSLREQLKGQGVDPADSWDQALALLENGAATCPLPLPAAVIIKRNARMFALPPGIKGRTPLDPLPVTLPRAEFSTADGRGKHCPPDKTIEWVAANLGVSDVTHKDAPSPEAWALLRWVRLSPGNETEFWKNLYTKILRAKMTADPPAASRHPEDAILQVLDDMEHTNDNPPVGGPSAAPPD